MLICAYEDRRHYLPGLQLLAHSLNSACPGQRLIVWCPESLLDTFRRELPDMAVTVRAWPHAEVSGWSVKPSVLLEALAEGHDEVVWMDSDLIVTAEFRDRFDRSDAIVVASEPRWATQASGVDRAERWGLRTARRFPNLINSCVIRVRPTHERLLREWQRRLTDREYILAQTMPFSDRAPHVRGDQDVLHALLTSTLFADVPVQFLRHGVDIAQCHMADGYTVRDRLRHAWRSLPPLIHSEGFKPWDTQSPRPVFLEVSPFVLVAQRYRSVLGSDTSWLRPSSIWGRGFRFLTRDEPNLAGIVPALATQLQRTLRLRTRLDGLVGHWRHSGATTGINKVRNTS